MCATASACVPITPTAALVRARRPPIWLIPRWLCGGACWRACGGRREHAQAGSSHPARSCEAPVGHPSSAAPRARLTEGRRTLRGAAGAHRGCLDRGWPTRIQTSRRIRAASEGRARASKPDWSCTRAGGGVSRTPDWLPLGLFLSPPSVPLDTSSAGGRPDSQEFLGLRWLVLAHSRRSLMLWRQHSGGAGREWPPVRWKETGEEGGAGSPRDTSAVLASLHSPPPALSRGGTSVPSLLRHPRPAVPTDLSWIRWQTVLCVPRGRLPSSPASSPSWLQLQLPPRWPASALSPPSDGIPAAAAPSTREISATPAAPLPAAPWRRQAKSTNSSDVATGTARMSAAAGTVAAAYAPLSPPLLAWLWGSPSAHCGEKPQARPLPLETGGSFPGHQWLTATAHVDRVPPHHPTCTALRADEGGADGAAGALLGDSGGHRWRQWRGHCCRRCRPPPLASARASCCAGGWRGMPTTPALDRLTGDCDGVPRNASRRRMETGGE